jgi:hypothetical protein
VVCLKFQNGPCKHPEPVTSLEESGGSTYQTWDSLSSTPNLTSLKITVVLQSKIGRHTISLFLPLTQKFSYNLDLTIIHHTMLQETIRQWCSGKVWSLIHLSNTFVCLISSFLSLCLMFAFKTNRLFLWDISKFICASDHFYYSSVDSHSRWWLPPIPTWFGFLYPASLIHLKYQINRVDLLMCHHRYPWPSSQTSAPNRGPWLFALHPSSGGHKGPAAATLGATAKDLHLVPICTCTLTALDPQRPWLPQQLSGHGWPKIEAKGC